MPVSKPWQFSVCPESSFASLPWCAGGRDQWVPLPPDVVLPFLVPLPALAPACSADSLCQGMARTLPAWEEMRLQPDIRDWMTVCHSRESTGGLAQLGCVFRQLSLGRCALGHLKDWLKPSSCSWSSICGGCKNREVSGDWKERLFAQYSVLWQCRRD